MKHILFVDDEQRVLDGLRRMLRGQRDAWEMTFVLSGDDALVQLGQTRYDVIVTDMRMPKMDGAALLTAVAERHPEVVRLVLSGHAEEEAALRALPVTHQFLSKPCDATILKGTVDRACALHELLTDPQLRSLLGGVSSLPALPKVYQELTTALTDPNCSLRVIADIVERDSAVSAKVLQVVNSAFFGLPKEMSSIHAAVSYLGLNMMQGIALSVSVFSNLKPGLSRLGFSMESLQDHAISVGRLARGLLPRGRQADDAFTAGMMHDIGKLILASHLPDKYEQVLRTCQESGVTTTQVEREIIGTTHGVIGAYLLGLWGLPYPIVEAVALHEEPSTGKGTEFGILGAVHVADALIQEHVPGGATDDPLDMAYLTAVGVADQVPAWRTKALEFVGVQVG